METIYIASVTNIGKISHISDYADPVPEPGTIGLLGAGFPKALTASLSILFGPYQRRCRL
jgi:hypothetical protein